MSGYQQFQSKLSDLRAKKSLRRKGVEDMTLQELLEDEKRFLEWAKTNGYSVKNPGDYHAVKDPEHQKRVYIYLNYAKPRIRELQKHEEFVNDVASALL